MLFSVSRIALKRISSSLTGGTALIVLAVLQCFLLCFRLLARFYIWLSNGRDLRNVGRKVGNGISSKWLFFFSTLFLILSFGISGI